jgi:hypothetical protein
MPLVWSGDIAALTLNLGAQQGVNGQLRAPLSPPVPIEWKAWWALEPAQMLQKTDVLSLLGIEQ